MTAIAIVEDDALLREELVGLYRDEGYTVHEAGHYSGLQDVLRLHTVTLIVLDLNLPGRSGYEIARSLREAHPGVGILMLTARAELQDRVQGFDVGADLYLTKPAEPSELLAATASLTRRLATEHDAATLHLDTRQQRLVNTQNQLRVTLTAVEAFLLRALALSEAQTADTGDLLDLIEVQFPQRSASQRSLENIISRLRQKTQSLIGSDAQMLVAVRGVGYRLAVPLEIKD